MTTDEIGSRIIFSDLALARRLEKAEGRSNANFVEARARLFPNSGAQWIAVAGALAMFDGISSPCTQSFGLGLFETVTPDDMDKIEEFFISRSAAVFHEISPLADSSLLAMLNGRGYQPIEFTSVMIRPINAREFSPVSQTDEIQTRLMRAEEAELFAQISARGWSEQTEWQDILLDLAKINASRADVQPFFAEQRGEPIATGLMSIHDGVALFAGASTVPQARKQGAQLALLNARLQYATQQGCDIALMCAQPGSASQRNAERQGFRIVYTRIKWQLANAGQQKAI
jgi:GNAT superfamily N-acetyltransferase